MHFFGLTDNSVSASISSYAVAIGLNTWRRRPARAMSSAHPLIVPSLPMSLQILKRWGSRAQVKRQPEPVQPWMIPLTTVYSCTCASPVPMETTLSAYIAWSKATRPHGNCNARTTLHNQA